MRTIHVQYNSSGYLEIYLPGNATEKRAVAVLEKAIVKLKNRMAAAQENKESGGTSTNKARQARKASAQICPKCNGVGWYACQVGVDTAEQCQCEDCGGTGKLLPC